jgi:hypothetical protein
VLPGPADCAVARVVREAENESARQVMGEPALRVIATELVASIKNDVTLRREGSPAENTAAVMLPNNPIGGNDPANPPTSPSTASLSRVARCWHSNAYFSPFSSLFFFDPPNRFVQIPRDLS